MMTCRILEGTNTSHIDEVQHGYENMEHFTADFELQRRALMKVDFTTRKKQEVVT